MQGYVEEYCMDVQEVERILFERVVMQLLGIFKQGVGFGVQELEWGAEAERSLCVLLMGPVRCV
jgi:hypothetical protein